MENKNFDSFMKSFSTYLKKAGLSNTVQKEAILKVLFEDKRHLNAEEIASIIKKKYQINIGIATVYRNLNFLENSNIVSSIVKDNSNTKSYEIALDEHHDHIICTECGKVVEFFDEDIEKSQLEIATANGFTIESHNMTIYGICSECKGK
ncbi:Fur family transcriptional regulator [Arcobacter sp. FWKO B]|uniref:Fur family transcriptional regulator n=1 Tax=Arcobacter sp. FWKO B TaxID=2593672 RepID=UPI0018A52DEF|nr:transcriptional repressor [Arcobacter sp. FWKO B]QOG12767.1 transcriptional repressor [Arcobacter sp. FWKO B]